GVLTHLLFRGSCHVRLPVARPTKFATVMGALSSRSLHWIAPLLVSMVATSGPAPGMTLFTSSRVHLPLSGSSGEGSTFKGGFGTGTGAPCILSCAVVVVVSVVGVLSPALGVSLRMGSGGVRSHAQSATGTRRTSVRTVMA